MTNQTSNPPLNRIEKIVQLLIKNKYLSIIVMFCFFLSVIFCLNDFPTGSDIATHYIKIINMREMLLEGKFIRWSYDWYCGYAMFDIYPPLIYMLVAAMSIVINDIALVMKIFTIASFTIFPLVLYKFGKALGRTSKGATTMTVLSTLTPLNIFFLFNGYFIFIPSLILMFLFLTEFFKHIQNHDKTSLLTSTVLLTVISFTYHRAIYFILFIMLFYFFIKIYRRELREATSIILMTAIGVGAASFWLLPAIFDMISLPSDEMYQSLILVASHNGLSFHTVSLIFIVPYLFLVYQKIRKKKVDNDSELLLLISTVFFTILSLGPYGLLYYIVPFSSSQRVEITLLMVTFLGNALSSSLFDGGVKEGKITIMFTLTATLLLTSIMVAIFFQPRLALGLESIDFTYDRGDLDDSVMKLVRNAYVEKQIFLGRNDRTFLEILEYISSDSRDGRVAFYANRSQTATIFYYYALLPLSGKSTPQGVTPEGEGDPKWRLYTQKIIWNPDETLLKISGVRWIITNYPLNLNYSKSTTFGEYKLYELDNVKMINGSEGTVQREVGKMKITLTQVSRSFDLAESYNPRWRGFDQDGREITLGRTGYGFMRISSTNEMREINLVYSDTVIDTVGKAISVACLALFVILAFILKRDILKLT